MYLTILDLVLVLLLFLFIAVGFALGLVQAIGALIGLAIGAWLGGMYYTQLGAWLTPIILGHAAVANVVAFILIFTIVNRLVGLFFYIINKVFNLISIIPFTKMINRFLGAALGLIEGVLALGLILWFVLNSNISLWTTSVITASKVAAFLIFMAQVLTPLLPKILSQVTTVL